MMDIDEFAAGIGSTGIGNNKCPCHSKKLYAECCEPYHKGVRLPATALELMRSRYSGYALKLADYIIDTALPASGKKLKRKEILDFCAKTQFLGLEIIEFVDGQTRATVTFRAILAQGFCDASFEEKSHFIRPHNRWLYQN